MKRLLLLLVVSTSVIGNPLKKILAQIVISKPAQFKIATVALFVHSGYQNLKQIKK